MTNMRVGFNYPWAFNEYGVQIGPYPYGKSDAEWARENQLISSNRVSSVKLPRLFDRLEQNLVELKRIGIDIVRWFLLCHGQNYGVAPQWRYADANAQDIIWNFDPPVPLDPRFAFYFRELLKKFRSTEMQLIPCFIDYPIVGGSFPPDSKNFAPGGRADCVGDAGKRSTFINWTLLDLLLTAKDFKDVIYAWDIINEPFWTLLPPVSPLLPLWRDVVRYRKEKGAKMLHWPMFGTGDLNQFLKDAIDMVELFKFKSTVGHRRFFDLTIFPTGNTPQYHYYAEDANQMQSQGHPSFAAPDPGSLSQFVGNPPPFLGEFASHLDKGHNFPWPDLKGKKDETLERLKLLEGLGCQLCLIWADVEASGVDDNVKLQAETRKQIKSFTGVK